MSTVLWCGSVLMAVITASNSIQVEEAQPRKDPLKEIKGFSSLIKIHPKPCWTYCWLEFFIDTENKLHNLMTHKLVLQSEMAFLY
jgi:hypothetical protein